MPPNNKLKKNIKNWLENSIPIKKMETSKNSNNLTKPMKPWATHKKEKCMTSMDQMEAPRDRTIFSTCSSVEAEEEELLKNVKKFKRLNPLKSHLISHFKTFIMAK